MSSEESPSMDVPFAWLCLRCHRHSQEDFRTLGAAELGADRRLSQSHPGEGESR